MTTPSETRAGKLLPVMIAEMRNFADVADRCEVTNAPPAIRTWADQLEALAASEPGEIVAWTEKDGDEWVVYDADSDVGQHIRDYQKDRHFKSIFPIYDKSHPAPEQPGKGVLALARKEFRDSDAAGDVLDWLEERITAPQPSDPAEGDAKCIWPDCGHDTNQSDPTPGCNGIGCSQPTATVRIDEAMTLAACNAYDRAAELDGEEPRELAQFPWMHAALTAALDPQVKR